MAPAVTGANKRWLILGLRVRLALGTVLHMHNPCPLSIVSARSRFPLSSWEIPGSLRLTDH